MAFRRVVFTAPLAPMMVVMVPVRTQRSKARRATIFP